MKVNGQRSTVKRRALGARRGITLLELAVSVAVGSIVFMILGAIFLAQGRYFAIQDALSETQYNAFQTVDAVGLYAASARRVMSNQTVLGTGYTSGTSTLVLEIPSVDSTGALIESTYDYVVFGRDPSDTSKFRYVVDAATGSDRVDGTFVKALLVDDLIFRYNTVSETGATAIEIYVRTAATARGQTITTPLGKIYYLGSS